MIKLPNNIQSLFRSSTHINSYKRAIEELVCNSLDAESTSIAIRVHVDNNSIQVIDNGFGVAKSDFVLLGQRYATSKCVDLFTLKSAPNKYGFRGDSLASIIDISKSVKITSRNENTEETWVKIFHRGKVQDLSNTAPRPSKGTTVEIKGFLYNRNIQGQTINILDEINNIKIFLEQLSLVHSNVSVSLRDDSKNEIIFKLHKNRDIYQTLSSLFGVKNSDVQELKVEKNEYKVTAIIGKQDKDISQCHWIYLNKKFVLSSKLHNIINENLTKSLGLKYQNKRKTKTKNDCNESGDFSRNKIPFYFIFITCPYYDYDISNTTNRSNIEFKNWDHVTRLLEKLVKFYIGDINLKVVPKPVHNQGENKEIEENTRDQVKKLIEKILSSNTKKGITQMHQGIKGKLIKRKNKSKKKMSLSKVILRKENDNSINHYNNDAQTTSEVNDSVLRLDRITKRKRFDVSLSKIIPLKKKRNHLEPFKTNAVDTKRSIKCSVVDKDFEVSNIIETGKSKANPVKSKIVCKNGQNKSDKTLPEPQCNINANDIVGKVSRKINKNKSKKVIRSYKAGKPNNEMKKVNIIKKANKIHRIVEPKNAKGEICKRKNKEMINPLILNFGNCESVKRRCSMLAKKVDELMSYRKTRKRKIFLNKTVHYSNITRNNKNVSIRKKVGEIVTHNYVPLPPKFYPCCINNRVWDEHSKVYCKSSYDLVRTIIRSQRDNQVNNTKKSNPPHEFYLASIYGEPRKIDNVQLLPKLTFESHNYQDNLSHSRNPTCNKNYVRKDTNFHFITKQSRDNFIMPHDKYYERKLRTEFRKPKMLYAKKGNMVESSYTIEFSQTNGNYDVLENNNENNVKDNLAPIGLNNHSSQIGITYTAGRNDDYIYHSSRIDSTYTVFSNTLQMFDNNYVNSEDSNDADYCKLQRTYCIQEPNSRCYSSSRIENEICASEENVQETSIMNVFMSKSQSQENNNEMCMDISMDSLHVSETELQNLELFEEELEANEQRQEESLCNDEFNVDFLICDSNADIHTPQVSCEVIHTHKSVDDFIAYIHTPQVSCEAIDTRKSKDAFLHNFDGFRNSDLLAIELRDYESNVIENNGTVPNPITIPEAIEPIEMNANIIQSPSGCSKDLQMQNQVYQTKASDMNSFVFKNRLRFVPKGMSQIFENCRSKNLCDYNFQEEYFEKTIYKNFANDVQANSEIFEPTIQNVKELASRNIEKVNVRLNKENASLIFNGESLKLANILGQIDDKFIAARMKSRSGNSMNMAEYLILFDQHAVHERIRLEKNLADYMNEDLWKSVPLDGISLKLTKDAVLYLHNYKDKFAQFGLQWTISNNSEITVTCIPEAILGKNPRQVELVMKAVKKLVIEEINTMKSQGGCISLYPKAIMDLVFSEACRYAIKFGDKLSKADCVNLLNSLSECKTPFQCAHGRPVMAVVMELKSEKREYKINKSKISQFIKLTKKKC